LFTSQGLLQTVVISGWQLALTHLFCPATSTGLGAYAMIAASTLSPALAAAVAPALNCSGVMHQIRPYLWESSDTAATQVWKLWTTLADHVSQSPHA
jgi:hypothetical protein